ncbi:ribosome-inactivating family protein [Streptomyces albireticuli]|nr:ribosome-inactivating family protein [Streptomyces albireticuli]MCD9145392.1 ribosome-inactivating family protein [Streptomyces albireticuli]MCD9165043.1 ribosome-inactivating family protein [Streptomyces albireticuli]MCD9195366.1 ribosome-inactivating family protein [Streptomyces albireticuli]
MALVQEDIFDNALDFSPASAAGAKRVSEMLVFLRQRYATFTAGQAGDARFFRIGVRLDAERTVQLYFRKQNLYLRGWTRDGGTDFMGAWDDKERKLDDAGRVRLIPDGMTLRKGSDFVQAEYGSGADKETLSRETMEGRLAKLHGYLGDVVAGRGGDTAGAEAALHVIARMTAEMARFGLFAKAFTQKWAAGQKQDYTVTVQLQYSPGQYKDYTTPPFRDAILKWAKLTKKSNSGTDDLKILGKDVVQVEAEAIIGGGAKWRPEAG